MNMTKNKKLDPISALAAISTKAGKGNTSKVGITERLLKDIIPDPDQPRKQIDMESISELAASIKTTGRLLQPIIVRDNPNGNGFMIVAGERRWRACNLLQWQYISTVHIDQFKSLKSESLDTDALILIIQLAENLGREDMSDFDTAAGLAKAKEEFSLSYEELATMVSRKKTTIHEMIRVYNGPIFIKKLFKDGVKLRPLLVLTKLCEIDEKFVREHVEGQLKKGGKISLSFAESLKSMLQQVDEDEENSSNDSNDSNDSNINVDSDIEEIGINCETIVPPSSEGDVNELNTSTADNSDGDNDSSQMALDDSLDAALGSEDTNEFIELGVHDQAFKKRPLSKALVSLKTPKGDGTLRLEFAPHNPTEVCVELSDGNIVSVPFLDCSIIGYE
ncbi:ParB/RepB/Spo0J family partition protein [Vibrio parahaemolyticus]|uniref:ParB/RepB/Spo0J family partition protein n=1 Tax=Vibrio harveyi group TaxID=717610 RepID=UPI0004D66861|nr:ParB/RepB/Spo0J family partition protein [Vibrio parahaemolyticus]EGQ8679242.1 ParB/RepB/Spo0J family partition protein [Vibrio parahaemolyticus]EGQ8753659.1 ParB/RepB/Spo0J family partition protein [Vibrio parahaemolyticus]EGQ8757474.1 ParB/RepB/Spo0J family partition protein [Vibrio parahaemolyticus]EGQ8771759.1 ParB/RepB/Spo0J family partition protein [Vibrio parahaemolyticus]EGQ8803503.1 ParB/RepB/Spo0J family partition protein [Vibrio parahaemolyticus]